MNYTKKRQNELIANAEKAMSRHNQKVGNYVLDHVSKQLCIKFEK